MNAAPTQPKRFYGTGLSGVNLDELTGKLIVVEGADGSGRSTQIELIKDELEKQGFATVPVGLRRSTLVRPRIGASETRKYSWANEHSAFFMRRTSRINWKTVSSPRCAQGFIVLADRYIYTLMARDVVRGMEPDWLESLFGIAIVPDAVFYLRVSPENLMERNFQKSEILDYWESGMDVGLSQDMFESFLKYQRQIQNQFRRMSDQYGFEIINGNRSKRAIAKELIKKVFDILG